MIFPDQGSSPFVSPVLTGGFFITEPSGKPQDLGLELNKILKPAFQLFVYTDSLEGNVSASPVYRCTGNGMMLDLMQFNSISIFVETYSMIGASRWFSGKESTCHAGGARDVDSNPGLGRSPRVSNVNPLHYSCLEDSMDRGNLQATVLLLLLLSRFSRVQLCATP